MFSFLWLVIFFLYCYIASVSSLFGENGQKSHTKSILPPVCGGTIYKLIVPYYTNFIHSSANKLSAQHNNNNSNSNSSSINSTTVQLNSQHIHTSKLRAESIHGQSALNRIGIQERNEQENRTCTGMCTHFEGVSVVVAGDRRVFVLRCFFFLHFNVRRRHTNYRCGKIQKDHYDTS